jgi:uncharacterized protein (TIGR00106 family)
MHDRCRGRTPDAINDCAKTLFLVSLATGNTTDFFGRPAPTGVFIMAVVEISVVPLGTATTSVSTYVAACVEVVAASGLNYRLTPMGTVIEGDLDDLLPVLRRMHEVPFQQGAQRVSTLLKIDDRRDREGSNFEQKITSVEDKLKSGS